MNSFHNSLLPAVAVALVLAAVGCGKKTNPAQTVESADATVSTTAAANAKPAPVVNPIVVPQAAAGDTSQILGALTQALRKYAVEHKGMPRNFSELVSAGYVRNLPSPPSGKKFEIDANSARVVLVNQ